MSGVRKRPVHPVVQRCLDKAGVASLAEAGRHESPQFIYKLAEPETMDGFVERMKRWSKAMGVTPEDFLAEVTKYIKETHPISSRQSKTAS